MKTTNDNHDARISCEETFTEDMGPATWANKPEMPDMVSIDKAFGDFAKACDKAVGKCQDFIDMDVTDKADRRKPKIVPIKPPTQKELDNSTSKGTRVLTYEESMER